VDGYLDKVKKTGLTQIDEESGIKDQQEEEK
jgi:hypothetical protein